MKSNEPLEGGLLLKSMTGQALGCVHLLSIFLDVSTLDLTTGKRRDTRIEPDRRRASRGACRKHACFRASSVTRRMVVPASMDGSALIVAPAACQAPATALLPRASQASRRAPSTSRRLCPRRDTTDERVSPLVSFIERRVCRHSIDRTQPMRTPWQTRRFP